jgi:segregation and condensation protein B
MNGRQTALMAIIGMALLATIMIVPLPKPTLALSHWNPDGDFTLKPESELESEEEEEMPIRPLSAGSALDSSVMEEEQQYQQQHQHEHQLPLQQEPIIVSTSEICDDDLDNDNDGKVDSRDEECSYITSSTPSLQSPRQAQPVIDENTEMEIEDSEQQPNDDLTEGSGGNGKENSNDEGSKEEDEDGDEEDENEDEDTEQESDNEDDEDGDNE